MVADVLVALSDRCAGSWEQAWPWWAAGLERRTGTGKAFECAQLRAIGDRMAY